MTDVSDKREHVTLQAQNIAYSSVHIVVIEYIGICLYMTAAVASKNHKTTKLHHESKWKMQEDTNEARVKPRHKRNM